MTTITVSYLRDNLPDVLSRVALLGEVFAVMRHGKKVAVLAPLADKKNQVPPRTDTADNSPPPEPAP